jgi:hypothetical protein
MSVHSREHDDLYEDVCKPALDRMELKLTEVLGYLKGDVDKPGLCERVRMLESWKKLMIGTSSAVALLLIAEVLHLIMKGL